MEGHDAVLMCGGSEALRDPRLARLGSLRASTTPCPISCSRTAASAARTSSNERPILAAGKHVVVIGGGDTASDCVGTAFRQGALSVHQLDIRPVLPLKEDELAVWPYWPTKFRTSSSAGRGRRARIRRRHAGHRGQERPRHLGEMRPRRSHRQPIPGTEFLIKADLVFIALGLVHPVHEGMLEQQGLGPSDKRGNVQADDLDYATSVPKLFAAGDMRRGQSLVVWAIREGRQAAQSIDTFLMGASALPR